MEYPVGWTCELVALRFEWYLVDTLPRGEALAVAEHLEACSECAQRLTMVSVRVARIASGMRGQGRG